MKRNEISALRIEKGKEPSKRKRRIIYLLIIIPLLSLVILILYRSNNKVETTGVSLVYPYQDYSLLSASGYVVPEKRASVGAKTTGTLEWIGVQEGSLVKKGQLIARLENRDLLAGLEQAKANLELQKANLSHAEAELYDARKDYERNLQLLEKGFISRAEFDASYARLLRAEALKRSQEASVRSAEAALRASEINLEYTLIKAPFDGVVLTKDADVGDIITPLGAAQNARASIVTIADLDSLIVDVDVSEQNISTINEGQDCVIELDAYPDRRFRGRVKRIIPTADRTKASIKVKVEFVERIKGILPDMSAKVTFVDRRLDELSLRPVIAVNPSSIIKKDGREIVYVVEDNRLREREVLTGKRIGESLIEIKKGLRPGEKVVLRPEGGLRSGMKIRLRD